MMFYTSQELAYYDSSYMTLDKFWSVKGKIYVTMCMRLYRVAPPSKTEQSIHAVDFSGLCFDQQVFFT